MATVGQLMTRDVRYTHEKVSIQEAARLMHQKHIGSLFVKNDEEFLGIVTETDVVKAVAEQPETMADLTVKDVMSSPIITVEGSMSPHYARDLMADRKIRHLGVSEDNKIVGVISVRDLLAYFKTVSHRLEVEGE